LKFVTALTAAVILLVYPGSTFASLNNEGGIGIQQLPGDYNNSCKVVATQKVDNVKYVDGEQKILSFIIGGGLGGITHYFTTSVLRSVIVGSLTQAYISVPKSSYVYVTIQHRECKDYTGVYRQFIISYYKDKARTKHLYTEYKR
jgi:hypothetical protein